MAERPSDSTPLASIRGFPAPAGPFDLDVFAGELVVLAGPNGSGKTSLLRRLAGLDSALHPDSCVVDGEDPAVVPAARLPTLVRASLHEPRETLVGLTVVGEFALRDRPVPQVLEPLADRDVARLSSGEARRVALAVAQASPARLLLLDEPSEGLDSAGKQRLLELVAAARRMGAVVVAEHDGLLGPLATRRVGLAPLPSSDSALALLPTGTEVVVEAPACEVAVGIATLALPAVRFTTGFHVLAGPNGSGKSTLLRRLVGLENSEEVLVDGLAPLPGSSARMLPARAADLLLGDAVAEDLEGCDPSVVAALVPPGLMPRHPLALSAGEAQRVALAATLGRPARLILLDEPEAHLDAAGFTALLEVLGRVAPGSAVVAATHDPRLLARAQHRIDLRGSA